MADENVRLILQRYNFLFVSAKKVLLKIYISTLFSLLLFHSSALCVVFFRHADLTNVFPPSAFHVVRDRSGPATSPGRARRDTVVFSWFSSSPGSEKTWRAFCGVFRVSVGRLGDSVWSCEKCAFAFWNNVRIRKWDVPYFVLRSWALMYKTLQIIYLQDFASVRATWRRDGLSNLYFQKIS